MLNLVINFAFALAIAACAAPQTDAQDANGETEEQTAQSEPEIIEIDMRKEVAKRAANNLAASKKFLAENAKRDGVITTDSGLQYMVLQEGPEGGAAPVSTDLVVVHYVGTLKDGVEFDSSHARGAASKARLNGVIPGWTEGVQLMTEGDRYRFFIPPELAYGQTGRPRAAIGPNEALIFEVELIKVHSPERNLAAANKFLDDNATADGVITTASGLQYKILSEGPADGASPTAKNKVKAHYQGTLINGTEFDSSYARGEPIEFTLNKVIKGWTEGVQLMSEGDKFRFFIPPDLAYGEAGIRNGPIGPNEALIFDVELIEVK